MSRSKAKRYSISFMVTLFLLFVRPFSFKYTVSGCCQQTQYLPCKKSCESIAGKKISTKHLQLLLESCPSSQVPLWACVNGSWIKRQGSSPYRSCCSQAKSVSCQIACHLLDNGSWLGKLCNLEVEDKLKRCLNRNQVASYCCEDASDAVCRDHCLKIFAKDTQPNTDEIERLQSACAKIPTVAQCVSNLTGHHNKKLDFSRCCAHSMEGKCKNTCVEIMSRKVDPKRELERLVDDCGFPLPQDRLWGCILKVSAAHADFKDNDLSQSPVQGVAIFREHCCLKATTTACRDWCFQVFKNPSRVSHWDPLYFSCMEDAAEKSLSICIGDVFEPCRFGCRDQMSFCSALHSRPLQLYRQCNSQGDEMARKLFTTWESGILKYGSVRLAIRNVRKCRPESWRAVACTLAAKPCSRSSKRLQICWSDCVDLLSSCTKMEHFTTQKSAEEICSILLPNAQNGECFSLGEFQSPGGITRPIAINPCDHNPCQRNEICVINHECNSRQKTCKTYRCLEGCLLTKSSIQISRGSYVKLLLPNRERECYRLCKCGGNGRQSNQLTQCVNVGCTDEKSCFTKDHVYGHKERFFIQCNYCTCFDGQLICTNKNCRNSYQLSSRPRRNHEHTHEMPCGCDSVYNPVCASSGVTFTNLCLARCAGIEDDFIVAGDCQSMQSCSRMACPLNMRCSTERTVCLDRTMACPQHKCEPLSRSAISEDEVSYGNTCQNQECRKLQFPVQVCGMDGATYANQADLHKAMVPVDYLGSCVNWNGLPGKGQQKLAKSRCEDIVCAASTIKGCKPYIPPLTCCPICGAVLRALYRTAEIRHHVLLVNHKPVTVRDILRQIQQLVYISYCAVRGYLSAEGDLVIIIQPGYAEKNTISQQFEGCHAEAERITGLFNLRSPLVTTNYYLSIIKAVRLESSFSESNDTRKSIQCNVLCHLLLSCIFAILSWTLPWG